MYPTAKVFAAFPTADSGSTRNGCDRQRQARSLTGEILPQHDKSAEYPRNYRNYWHCRIVERLRHLSLIFPVSMRSFIPVWYERLLCYRLPENHQTGLGLQVLGTRI